MFDLPPEPPKLWLPPKPAIIRPATPDLIRRPSLARKLLRSSSAALDATVAFLQFAGSATDLTTYNFGTLGIGTPGGDRYIGMIVEGVMAAAARTASSVTVDGSSLAFAGGAAGQSAASNLGRIEIWMGAVPSGNSTGNVTVVWSGAMNNCKIAMFECHNIQSATATAVDGDSALDNTAMTGSVLAGGIVLAGARNSPNTTMTWGGGVTDHGDQVTESSSMSAASLEYASAGTATATPDAATNGSMATVLATFR